MLTAQDEQFDRWIVKKKYIVKIYRSKEKYIQKQKGAGRVAMFHVISFPFLGFHETIFKISSTYHDKLYKDLNRSFLDLIIN